MILKIKKYLKKVLPHEVFEIFKNIYTFRFFIRLFSIDQNSDYKNTIILSGSGRSGTTWVGNILNYNNEYRYMFEPFNSSRVKTFKKFYMIPYLRIDDHDNKMFWLVNLVLTGRIKNAWINKYNRKIIARKRLIKEVYINLLLGWIKVNFPEIPVIFLMRHPFAIALSKVQVGWWEVDAMLNNYLSQKNLVEDFLKDKVDIAKSLTDDFSKHIFIWCIETIVPLSQLKDGQVYLAFYENFCTKPKEEIKRLFDFLGKEFDDKIFKIVTRPSQVATADSAIVRGANLIDGWKNKLDEEQIEKAISILKLFKLDKIYSRDIFPNVSEAYRFIRKEK
jgi:hypothetical protein